MIQVQRVMERERREGLRGTQTLSVFMRAVLSSEGPVSGYCPSSS